MKKLALTGLLAFMALTSGCASVSSTYNKHQELKPRAAQAKAKSLGALQIRTSGAGQEVVVGAGIDWTKIGDSVGFTDTFKEDPKGMSWAMFKDGLKAAALGFAAKELNDYVNKDSSNNDNPTGPAIQATNGGRISVNNAPDGSYKDHTLKANGNNSSIDLNFVAPEKEQNNNAPFNLDGTPNLDGNI